MVKSGLIVQGQPTNITLDYAVKFYDSMATIKEPEIRKKLINEFKKSLDITNALFVGKTQTNKYGLFLTDKNTKARPNIFVDSLGAPRLEFLDSTERIIYALPN